MKNKKGKDNIHLGNASDSEPSENEEDKNNEAINEGNFTKENKDNESNIKLSNDEQKEKHSIKYD